jgi:glycosyltransferase involved in cell wall biosynthesis
VSASPRISVIIPSYNQGAYLEQAICSVLEQDYPALELLVVDGASADNSLDIIRKYENRLGWWVSEPDQGQSDAINKGFARATGEIITFLSSDDYYLPGAFADVAARYRQNPNVGAIIGAFSFLDEGQPVPDAPILPFLNIPSPCDLTLGPPAVYRLHQVSTFYTRAALDAVGRSVREDLKYVMDRELLYRVCRRFPLVLSNLPYGVFRRHAESKSVAQILPFAREFAQIYREALNGDPRQDQQRRDMANYRLSRGYIKYANAVAHPLRRWFALFMAAKITPSLALSPSYWAFYLKQKKSIA